MGGRVLEAFDPAHLNSPRLAQMLFLWIGAPTALLLCFLIGPFEAADEAAHFLRSVAISEGHFVPEVSPADAPKKAAGASVSTNASVLTRDFEKIRNTPEHRYSLAEIEREDALRATSPVRFAAHSNTAIYPPFLYIASSLAAFFARLAGFPLLWWLYLGRLANAVVAILIIRASLGRSGDASLFLFASALLPITLFQVATLSADALLFPLLIAFAAMTLAIERGEETSRSEVVLLGATTLFLCAGKVAYLPFAVLPPLAARLADRRWSERASILFAAAFLATGTWIAWALVVDGKVFSIRPNIEIDPKAQLQLLASHPLASARFFLHQMVTLSPKLVIGAVGTRLGWGELHLPSWLIYPLPFLLIAAAIPAESPGRRIRAMTVASVATAIACYCAIFLLIYLQYNAVGAAQIGGVQGRYFTPVALLILSQTPKMRTAPQHMAKIWACAAALATLTSIVTLLLVVRQYW
jgi:uncharacterized membrane protein